MSLVGKLSNDVPAKTTVERGARRSCAPPHCGRYTRFQSEISRSYTHPPSNLYRCNKQPTFLSLFLKVSVEQLSQNLYIPINNPQGGGDISPFSGKKPGGTRTLSSNIGQIKDKIRPERQSINTDHHLYQFKSI